MPGAPTPPNLLAAIASAAGAGYITNPLPETPTGSNSASVEGGFPPVTMTSELAGGEPPLGQDMNGLFFLVSSHSLYVECGQLYQFNATLAAAIGGYLAGTVLGMADGTGMWLNVVNGNTANPDTGGAGWVPLNAYGYSTITSTGGVVTATAAEAKYGVIVLAGVLASNLTVNLPQTKQQWLVVNTTTGAFTATVQTAAAGSTGVVVPQGGFSAPVPVYSIGDGNIYPQSAGANLPAYSQAATALTLAQRTNAGYLLATYFQSSASASENPTVGAVAVQNAATDGFIRFASAANFAAQMAAKIIGGTIAQDGVLELPIGGVDLIIQWGFHTGANAGAGLETIPLNVAFPNACLLALVNGVRNTTGTVGTNFVCNLTTTQFQAVLDRSTQSVNNTRDGYWIAIGY